MRLIAPFGGLVHVSEEKGERLKLQGYREVQAQTVELPEEPDSSAPKRRPGRPKKVDPETE